MCWNIMLHRKRLHVSDFLVSLSDFYTSVCVQLSVYQYVMYCLVFQSGRMLAVLFHKYTFICGHITASGQNNVLF